MYRVGHRAIGSVESDVDVHLIIVVDRNSSLESSEYVGRMRDGCYSGLLVRGLYG
jgi:hypothetical protein